MQPFLGIAPGKSAGAATPPDTHTRDARSAADPANGRAFRSAMNAANERSGGSEQAERRPSRPHEATGRPNEATNRPHEAASHSNETAGPVTDAATTDGDLAVTEDDYSAAEAAPSADALAMLLTWPVPITPAPTEMPAGNSLTGSADAAGITVATGITAGPETAPPATGQESPVGAEFAAALPTDADGPAPIVQAGSAQANTTPATPDGIAIPAEMTLTPDGAPVALPTASATTTASAAGPLDPSLLATLQATAEGHAAAAASAASAGSPQAAAQAAGTPAPADLAALAAEFGAQIVATTGPTAGRTALSADAPAPLLDDALIPTTGSTAQAAGAGAAAGVQLPGQAVAAAGAAGQGTSSTLAEALETGPEAVTGARATTETSTEFQATLGATSNVTQAQSTATIQGSTTTAPPITNQIADSALMAARRVGQSVEMILQPEGLGSVSLRVTAERGGLAVHLAVENPQAREMVQASWPQLQQALEQRGLTVQSMMLDLSNGRGGDGFQAFQQFNGQQQFSGQQARGGAGNPDRRGSAPVSTIDDSPRLQASAGAAGRVDYRI